MAAFRLVNADQAGPGALGLLVPPGRRTLVIVRPRPLPWDLLIVHSHRTTGPTTTFRQFGREEAEAAVEGLHLALEQWAAGGPGQVRAVPEDDRAAYLVRGQVGIFPLLACPREAGKPYRPLLVAQREEAQHVADALAAFLCPAAGADREVYFNARHFAR